MLPNKPISLITLFDNNYSSEYYSFCYAIKDIYNTFINNYSEWWKAIYNTLKRSFTSYEVFNSYVILNENSKIRVNMNYFQAIKYNYCCITYEDNTYLFCYIDSYEMINNEITTITLKIDTLTTFLPSIKGIRGLLDRAHTIRYYMINGSSYYLPSKDCMFSEGDIPSNYIRKKCDSNENKLECVIVFNFPSEKIELYNEQKKIYSINAEESKLIFYYGYNNYDRLIDNETFKYQKNSNVEIVICSKYYDEDLPDIYPTLVLEDLSPRAIMEYYPSLVQYIKNIFYIPSNFINMNVENNELIQYIRNDTKKTKTPYRQLKDYRYLTCVYGTNLNLYDKALYANNDILKHIDNDLPTQYIKNDIKLDCYPFTYYSCIILNNELTYSVNEIDYSKFEYVKKEEGIVELVDYNFLIETLIKNISYSIDPLSSTANINLSYTLSSDVDLQYGGFDIYTTFKRANNEQVRLYEISKAQENFNLYSVNIYQSQYNDYVNYSRALVESNNKYATINSGIDLFTTTYTMASNMVSGGQDIALGLASGDVESISDGKQKIYSSGIKGTTSIIKNALNIAKRYEQTAIKENNFKKKPPKSQVDGNSYNIGLYGRSTSQVLSVKNTLYESQLKIYNDMFYNYGYHIPVYIDVEYGVNHIDAKKIFNVLFNSRMAFNYIKFTELEIITDNLPIVYKLDIERRLKNGATLIHFEKDKQIFNHLYGRNAENEKIISKEEWPSGTIYGIFNNTSN